MLIAVGLIALTWAVFAPTLNHGFVNYDDRVYVLQNAQVRSGLSLAGIGWAFSHEHAGNWHPLTTITHMADSQWFGQLAKGHHFTNVLLHSLAVLLLFFGLRQFTGALWRSALVAAVFAVHPLRVESVAWIAERKDVLSAFFFMLTLLAYAWYARRPGIGRYLVSAAMLACGLLSKPMLVTVPVILLLLDYWPLQRHTENGSGKEASWLKLLAEKIPLVLLSIPTSIATFLIQERSAGSIAQLPISWRLQNGIVTFFTYIGQMFWPVNLAVFYPHPENQSPIWQVIGATALLVALTATVFLLRKTRPYLMVGWLWYVVMLLPVIGIIQVGLQGHADRYTYLPQIGLYIAIAWLIADLTKMLPQRRLILPVAGIALVGMLSACAWKQVSYWQDSEVLWRHTLAVTKENDVAETNLGMVLAENGVIKEGIEHLQNALAIRSGSSHPHYILSLALIHCDLGYALARKGELNEAVTHLRESVKLQPNYADAHYNLATALSQQGQTHEALEEFRKTLALRPTDAEAHTSLGNALAQEGRVVEARAQFEEALRLAPDTMLACNNLAWILSASPDEKVRDGHRAIDLARRAVDLSGGTSPLFLRTLAAAYAEVGRFSDAIETVKQAVRVAEAQNNPAGVSMLEADMTAYRGNSPLRDQTLGR